jgi:hypothetical protein
LLVVDGRDGDEEMIDVVIYVQETGDIRRTMRLMDIAEVELNCAPGESWLEGTADIRKQRVQNGKVVGRDPAALEAAAIAQAWTELYDKRLRRLYASDWTQVPDAPVDRAAWAAYRQALRDLPQNTPDPRYPVWPEPPQ